MDNRISITIKIILQIALGIVLFNMVKIFMPILSKIEYYYYFIIIGVIVLFHINNIFILFKKATDKQIKLFNIYYINYSKVFEICMLINNKRKEKEEVSFRDEYSNKYSIGATGKITKNIGNRMVVYKNVGDFKYWAISNLIMFSIL